MQQALTNEKVSHDYNKIQKSTFKTFASFLKDYLKLIPDT